MLPPALRWLCFFSTGTNYWIASKEENGILDLWLCVACDLWISVCKMSREAQNVPIVTLAGVANIGDCKYSYIGMLLLVICKCVLMFMKWT